MVRYVWGEVDKGGTESEGGVEGVTKKKPLKKKDEGHRELDESESMYFAGFVLSSSHTLSTLIAMSGILANGGLMTMSLLVLTHSGTTR
jgi:hypothetical protein